MQCMNNLFIELLNYIINQKKLNSGNLSFAKFKNISILKIKKIRNNFNEIPKNLLF